MMRAIGTARHRWAAAKQDPERILERPGQRRCEFVVRQDADFGRLEKLVRAAGQAEPNVPRWQALDRSWQMQPLVSKIQMPGAPNGLKFNIASCPENAHY